MWEWENTFSSLIFGLLPLPNYTRILLYRSHQRRLVYSMQTRIQYIKIQYMKRHSVVSYYKSI